MTRENQSRRPDPLSVFPIGMVKRDYGWLLKTRRSEKSAKREQLSDVNQPVFAGGIGVYCAEINSHLPAARSAT